MEIAEKFLRKEIAFLRTQGHNLTVDDSVLPFLVRKGFHPKLGARPMRDAVEKSIGDAVAGSLLAGGDASGRLQVDERTDVLLIVRNVCEALSPNRHGLFEITTPAPRHRSETFTTFKPLPPRLKCVRRVHGPPSEVEFTLHAQDRMHEAWKVLETFSNSTDPRKQGGRNTPETKGTG